MTVGHMKKCTLYKYFLYTVKYKSVDGTVNHCIPGLQLFHCIWSNNFMYNVQCVYRLQNLKTIVDLFFNKKTL